MVCDANHTVCKSEQQVGLGGGGLRSTYDSSRKTKSKAQPSPSEVELAVESAAIFRDREVPGTRGCP